MRDIRGGQCTRPRDLDAMLCCSDGSLHGRYSVQAGSTIVSRDSHLRVCAPGPATTAHVHNRRWGESIGVGLCLAASLPAQQVSQRRRLHLHEVAQDEGQHGHQQQLGHAVGASAPLPSVTGRRVGKRSDGVECRSRPNLVHNMQRTTPRSCVPSIDSGAVEGGRAGGSRLPLLSQRSSLTKA